VGYFNQVRPVQAIMAQLIDETIAALTQQQTFLR
jgi:hypothetical protein